jgi:outer membrane protein OmpA-like peptidoglycan-associated protein
MLAAQGQLRLAIEGHTDNAGSAAANKPLSQQRAQAVVTALTARGIAGARLTAAGFGSEKPIADNATEAGRAKNRRVELVKR